MGALRGFGVLGSVVFFFFFGDRCIKEEVNMAELGMDLILMVAALSFFVSMVELALKRKKRSSLFSSIGG